MNKKKLIKQNKDQPQRVEGRFLFFLATLTGSMPVRGAGWADQFGVSPVVVFRRHCWPFSGTIAGAPSCRLHACCRHHCRRQSKRHCRRLSKRHLAVCALVAGTIGGAIEGAVFRRYLLVAGAVSLPFAAPFQARFKHQIRSFNKGEILNHSTGYPIVIITYLNMKPKFSFKMSMYPVLFEQ